MCRLTPTTCVLTHGQSRSGQAIVTWQLNQGETTMSTTIYIVMAIIALIALAAFALDAYTGRS